MSITALVVGKLIADPERRVGQSGKPFTLAKVATVTEDGDALVSIISFGTVAEQLAAMSKGETVAATGRIKIASWTGKDGAPRTGLSMTADTLLTMHHLRRKRAAMCQGPGEPAGAADGPGGESSKFPG